MTVSRRTALTAVTGVTVGASLGVPASAAAAAGGPAHEAIRAVVDGIDRAVDDKAWERCRAFFAAEVRVDFTALNGGEPVTMPADELVAAWRANLFAEKASYHSRTNHEVTVRGSTAAVRSVAYAFNRLTRPLGDDVWELWAVYEHELTRTAEGWRCTAIAIAEVLDARGNEIVRTYVRSS